MAQCQALLFPVALASKHQEVSSGKALNDAMTHLDSLLKNLEQIVVKTLGDVDAKKKMLKTDQLLRIERQLMVWFQTDEQKLKAVYRDLNARLDVGSIKE